MGVGGLRHLGHRLSGAWCTGEGEDNEVGNCQAGIFPAYTSPQGPHTLLDRARPVRYLNTVKSVMINTPFSIPWALFK